MHRVLLAGQDDNSLDSLRGMLTKGPYHVTFTESDEEAIRKIGTADIAIVNLKSGSGVHLVAKMRAIEPRVPILVLTGEKNTLAKAMVNGATEWVAKPINPIDLEERISHVLKKSGAEKRGSPIGLTVPLPHLHDPQTGRIDAARVAEHMGIPLKLLAGALGANYTTVHRTPAAESLQGRLLSLKRILAILEDMIGDAATVRAWLNSQHPDLGTRTPISVILEGHVGAVETILENALAGTLS